MVEPGCGGPGRRPHSQVSTACGLASGMTHVWVDRLGSPHAAVFIVRFMVQESTEGAVLAAQEAKAQISHSILSLMSRGPSATRALPSRPVV